MMKARAAMRRFSKFVKEDLWDLDFHPLTLPKKILLGGLKVCFIVGRGFGRDHCSLHAGALTYTTLLSLVPLLALMFAVAKGFGAGEKLRETLAAHMETLPENVGQYLETMLRYVDNTHFGVLGAAGLLFLLYTVIATLGKVERSFNHIWGIRQERPFFRKFTDYLSVMLVVPLLVLAATSVNATLSSPAFLGKLASWLPWLGFAFAHFGTLTGCLFIWTAFAFLYAFMPNAKVKWWAAAGAGVAAGTLFQLLQWAYIHLQIGVSNYNAVYGTFASVPIFMAWLYLCWEIVLFGCEAGFALQNVTTYEDETMAARVNEATREALAVAIMAEAGRIFAAENGGWSPAEFSRRARTPIRLVREVTHRLAAARLLYAVEKSERYLPGRPLETIRVADIHEAIRGKADLKTAARFGGAEVLDDKTRLKDLIEKK